MNTYRKLLLATLAMTFALIVLGAYVRLSDAGLGCPDWPGCYGHATVTQASDHITAAQEADPHGPVARQYLPDARELIETADELQDPIGDAR